MIALLVIPGTESSPIAGIPDTCPAFQLNSRTWIACDLNTKTDYYPQQTMENYTQPPAGCQAVHSEYVARHGSRQPSGGDVKLLAQLSQTLQQHASVIRNPDYAWMKSWSDPYTPANSMLLLIPDGANEHYYTAQRMMQNYPQVFAHTNYTPNSMVFQSTQISRTGQSGSSFAFGLLQNKGVIGGDSRFVPYYIYTESLTMDYSLRFFDNCPAFQKQLNAPETLSEATLWADKLYPPLAAVIAQEIGSFPDWVPDPQTVSTMFTACQYDVAVANDTSHFCALFNETAYELLSYGFDLAYYYQRGYGYDINWQQATLLLQEMVNNTLCVIQKGAASCPAAKMRFAHAETIMPFVSILGLFRDPQPLTADWTLEQRQNRQWRTAVITPFASNVNIMLYQCPSNQYKVKVLANEQEMLIPGCDGLYCSFPIFQQIVQQNYYDFSKICYVDDLPPSKPNNMKFTS